MGVDETSAPKPDDLDRTSGIPLSDQIAILLRQRIDSGEWPAHYRLRPEPGLAAILGVSRGTLRKALTQLTRQGLLVQVRGKGTFVTSREIESHITHKLTTLMEDFAAQGIQVTTEVRDQRVIPSPSPIAALLDITTGAPILRLERRRSDNQGPVALLVNYVRTDLTVGCEEVDFTRQTLFGYLENSCNLRISHGRRTFGAVPAPKGIDQLLGVEPHSPLLYLEQITYLATGDPVEVSDVWIKSDRMRPTAILPRR